MGLGGQRLAFEFRVLVFWLEGAGFRVLGSGLKV